MRNLVPILLVFAAVCLVFPAGAEEPGYAPAAEALFQQGREAFERGDFATARSYFAESHRLDPAPGTLLNLAIAESKLGELAEAWQHAKEVLDKLPPNDDRVPIARELYADVARRVPRIALSLAPDAPPGTRVLRDGVELGKAALGASLPVNPGPHQVSVTAPGRHAVTLKLVVREGDVTRRVVAPGPPLAVPPTKTPTPPAKPPTADSPSNHRTLGYLLIGGGALGLATSAVMGGLVMKQKAEVDDHCDAERRCDDTAFDAADRGKTYSTVGTVSFVAGAALTGAGLYFVLSSPSSAESPPTTMTFAPTPHGAVGAVRWHLW